MMGDIIVIGDDKPEIEASKKPELKVIDIALREVNGRLFDKAYSDDPLVACQAIGKLVSTLQESVRQMGTSEYDEILKLAFFGSNRAWSELTHDKEPGRAMQTVRAVLTFQLGRFAFDRRFTTLDTASFVGGK